MDVLETPHSRCEKPASPLSLRYPISRGPGRWRRTLLVMASLAGAIAIDNGTVIVLITLIVLPIAAIAFAGSGTAWKQIGKGQFAIEPAPPPSAPAAPATGDDRAIREVEARQMLEAKSYRRVRQGEPALDVEEELRQVLGDDAGQHRPSANTQAIRATDGAAHPPEVDPALREEVRRLVIIRNERRVREGQRPLEVEAETERQLADFIGSPTDGR